MGARIGWHANIYVESQLCKLAQDFTFAVSTTEVESKNRGSRWIKFLKGLRTVPIDFEMTTNESDPTYQALKASFDSDSDDDFVEIEFTNKLKTKPDWGGFKGDFIVTKFEQSEPMDDEAKTSVSIRLAAGSDNEPTYTKSA